MTGQANFLQSLGWAVLNSLWQMALLWIIYQLITSVFRKSKSTVNTSVASSLLIGGFGWFLYTFFSVFTGKEYVPILSSVTANQHGNPQLSEWLQQTLPAASVLYLVLLVLPLLHFIRNYRYVQVIRKYGLSKINVQWRVFVNKIAEQMAIRKKVQIWVSEFVSSPVTIGFLKPVVLVPLAAINHLTPQQLEAVLLHELSHIKRFDYLINLIINFIQTILYFNPFVKSFVKIVEREREKSCDEMVLQFQYDSYEYATALLELEKANHGQKTMAIAASGNRNDLLHRVELIMGVQRNPSISFNKLAGLLSGLLFIITLNAFLLFSKSGDGSNAMVFSSVPSHINSVQRITTQTNIQADATEKKLRVHNHIEKVNTDEASTPSFADYVTDVIGPALINASVEIADNPELKRYQEEQVQKTMLASKKILEGVQWKVVEKSIADVFNQQEKDELKASYEKEMEKFDWKKWENSLKLAYDKIDWNKINNELSFAVNQLRLDSIQLVYNKAINKLEGAHRELTLNNMNGIPDTDITLKEIEKKKMEVQRTLNELKIVRKKKIVHL
jgi:beta-lactamase regulating signal transducer with metallopeptidase domain